MNNKLLQITPQLPHTGLGIVAIFASCHPFFLSVDHFLRKVGFNLL